MNTASTVKHTKSGLLVRMDKYLGAIVFSPYTGLIFACERSDIGALFEWLDRESNHPPSIEYVKALGPGWKLPMSEADFPSRHLLPCANAGWSILRPAYPIVINWLVTGKCPLHCKYCYAQDVMHGEYKEPSENDVKRIADTILSYHPLAVVLTGGDPLLSPNLEKILETLYLKTGIIVDTSGLTFSANHLTLFQKYNVFVRISLDSEIPRVNDTVRSCSGKQSAAVSAVDTLSQCIDAGIGVSVQTVVTKFNRSDLEMFGDKLFRMGVRSWRILLMVPASTNIEQFEVLRGSISGQKRFDKYTENQLRFRHEKGWNKGMGVQITHNRSPNSVVLVAPNGDFLTESKVERQKISLDPMKPKRPRLGQLFARVDSYAHTERYLNL